MVNFAPEYMSACHQVPNGNAKSKANTETSYNPFCVAVTAVHFERIPLSFQINGVLHSQVTLTYNCSALTLFNYILQMCREVPTLKRDKSMPGFELRPVNKLSRLVRRRVLPDCNERRFDWLLKSLVTTYFSIGVRFLCYPNTLLDTYH